MTYCLSIEPTGKPSYQYGYHLGTDERLARSIVEEKFAAMNAAGFGVCTMALVLDREVVDVFDGRWSSDVLGELIDDFHRNM